MSIVINPLVRIPSNTAPTQTVIGLGSIGIDIWPPAYQWLPHLQ